MSLAACDVGEVPVGGGGGGGGGGADGGGGGSGSLMFATTCVDRSATPGSPHLHTDDNTSHAGQACLNAGCHGPAQPGGEWMAGGTVLNAAGQPNAGAVVRILSGGKTLQAVVDTGGTFYIAPGAGGLTSLAFPAITDVSACPGASAMTTHLATGNGNCSQQGCHQATGGQGPIRGLQ